MQQRYKKKTTDEFADNGYNTKTLSLEPKQALQSYSLRVVAFGWNHSAGRLSQSDLVGSGGDSRPQRRLELPPSQR